MVVLYGTTKVRAGRGRRCKEGMLVFHPGLKEIHSKLIFFKELCILK